MLKRICLFVLTFMLLLSGSALAQPSWVEVIDGMANIHGPYVNPGGTGDSLIYGYYNVRNNLNLIVLGNTSTNDGAKVRIIFRNGKDSKECLDYSICLSKGDVYTAYLIDTGTTAAVCPFDRDTLTAPIVPAACQPFKYDGAGGLPGVTADDCREGYIEVIGLSRIANYDGNDANSCGYFRDGCRGKATESQCRDHAPSGFENDVGNTLIGNNTIFTLDNLATYSSNAVAVGNTILRATNVTPGAEKSIPQVMDEYWFDGCDAADAIFMKSNVIAPYDLMAAIGGETELVITFPTRYTCHQSEGSMFCRETETLDGDYICDDYCADIGIHVWDDKENRLDITDFSPSVGRCLPYEVNVIKLGGSQIWNSSLSNTISVGSFDLGWIDLDLIAGQESHGVCVEDDYCTYGLPAIAFTTQSFVGGVSSYMLPAAYKTSWETIDD